MKLRLANLNHDVSCLISAFVTARKSGKFDVKSLSFKEISPERLNCASSDESTQSKRVHFADLNNPNSADLLKAELHHSEEIISSLQQELKSLKNQYESLLSGVIYTIFFFFIIKFLVGDEILNRLKGSSTIT